jgi:hypothetical protein
MMMKMETRTRNSLRPPRLHPKRRARPVPLPQQAIVLSHVPPSSPDEMLKLLKQSPPNAILRNVFKRLDAVQHLSHQLSSRLRQRLLGPHVRLILQQITTPKHRTRLWASLCQSGFRSLLQRLYRRPLQANQRSPTLTVAMMRRRRRLMGA